MSFFTTGARSFSKAAALQLTKTTTLVSSSQMSLSVPALSFAPSSASLSQLYIQASVVSSTPQMSSIHFTTSLTSSVGSDTVSRVDMTKALAVLETATATSGEAMSSKSMAVAAAVTTTALVTYSSGNSSTACEGDENRRPNRKRNQVDRLTVESFSGKSRGASDTANANEDALSRAATSGSTNVVVPFDMGSVLDLRALDGDIDPRTIHLTRQIGRGHTIETFQGSAFQLHKNMVTMSKGGKDETRRIYEAATSPELLGVMTFVHNGILGATDHTRFQGFGFYEMNPKDSNHKAAVGALDNFREVFARKAKFKNWRELGKKLTPSQGWELNPKTPMVYPTPAGEKPNKYRMFSYHKEGCNFFNGGPPNMGGNKERAKYRRENRAKKRKEKKRLAKLEEAADSKPAATKRRRVSPSNKEDSKPAAKPAASDRASRYAARATAKK